jgi:NTP pyrophosphatase (non-canonical NTP hydrolase)
MRHAPSLINLKLQMNINGGIYVDSEKQSNRQESLDTGINQLCAQAFETAKSKGWHDEPREMGTLLALIHSEVSEALEADRKGDAENFVEELADVCIRIFDLCGAKEIDLEAAILKKMERNKGRSYKHGGKAY